MGQVGERATRPPVAAASPSSQARLYEQEREDRQGSAALGMYVRRWVGWAGGGLGVRLVPLYLPTATNPEPTKAEKGHQSGPE